MEPRKLLRPGRRGSKRFGELNEQLLAGAISREQHQARAMGLVREPTLLQRRQWRRVVGRADFTGRLDRELRIPRGPRDRPGERLLVPSKPLHSPRVTVDESREDFRVIAGAGGSTFTAVCLGPHAGSDALASAAYTVRLSELKGTVCSVPPCPERLGELDTVHYRLRFLMTDLYEWKFARDGWVFVAGMHRKHTDPEDATIALARRMLATWRWTDPPRYA